MVHQLIEGQQNRGKHGIILQRKKRERERENGLTLFTGGAGQRLIHKPLSKKFPFFFLPFSFLPGL